MYKSTKYIILFNAILFFECFEPNPRIKTAESLLWLSWNLIKHGNNNTIFFLVFQKIYKSLRKNKINVYDRLLL